MTVLERTPRPASRASGGRDRASDPDRGSVAMPNAARPQRSVPSGRPASDPHWGPAAFVHSDDTLCPVVRFHPTSAFGVTTKVPPSLRRSRPGCTSPPHAPAGARTCPASSHARRTSPCTSPARARSPNTRRDRHGSPDSRTETTSRNPSGRSPTAASPSPSSCSAGSCAAVPGPGIADAVRRLRSTASRPAGSASSSTTNWRVDRNRNAKAHAHELTLRDRA